MPCLSWPAICSADAVFVDIVLQKIWPDQCCVEMYGSCATQLDLPSSDLDLVVCGLDDADNHPPVDPQIMNSVHRNNSSTSFQEEEMPHECLAAPTEPRGREQPVSPEHYIAENSESASFQEGGEPSITPDHFAESVGEGDPGMMLDQSADGMPGIEYSPSAVVDNYLPEYHESNQQEGATGAKRAVDIHKPRAKGGEVGVEWRGEALARDTEGRLEHLPDRAADGGLETVAL